MAQLFHWVYREELFLWIPLAYFAATMPAARRWLLAPLLASAFAAAYEAYMTFVWEPTVSAPIRVDILLVMVFVALVNAVSGMGLATSARGKPDRNKWWGAAILCLSVPVLALAGFAFMRADLAALDKSLDLGKRMRFEAALRDDASQKRVFGNLRSDDNPWAGYYLGGAEDDRFKHLVINDKGEFWLYHSMFYESTGKGAQGAPDSNAFEGQGSGRMNAKMRLTLRRQEAGPYLLSVDFGYIKEAAPKAIPLQKTTPPRFPRPPLASDQVRFVGVFSGTYGERADDFWLVQMWLWESNGEMWGRYLHDAYKRGATKEFIHAEEIEPACAQECKQLTLATGRGQRKLTRISEDEFRGLYGSPPGEVTLRRGEALPGFLLDLAPLGTKKENQEWLKAVLEGHMITWDVPAR